MSQYLLTSFGHSLSRIAKTPVKSMTARSTNHFHPEPVQRHRNIKRRSSSSTASPLLLEVAAHLNLAQSG
jgi:hypothetical protein